LRTEFAVNPVTNVSVVIPDMSSVSPEALNDYAAKLSRVSDVSGVSTPGGTFVTGQLVVCLEIS
jgi:putative drug exporter of the RND superfamily